MAELDAEPTTPFSFTAPFCEIIIVAVSSLWESCWPQEKHSMPSIEKHWLSMNGLVNLDWEDCDQKYMTEHNVLHIILKKGFITISVI